MVGKKIRIRRKPITIMKEYTVQLLDFGCHKFDELNVIKKENFMTLNHSGSTEVGNLKINLVQGSKN